MITFIRGIIKSITSSFGEFARADVAGRGDDTCREMFEDREIFGHYGFASAPPVDAECLLIRQGQNVYIIASEDRRCKLELNAGEVMLYDEYNNKIHLEKGGDIFINAARNVIINDGTKGAARVDDEVEVTIIEPVSITVGGVAGAITPPVTLKGKITEGSNTVKIGG